MESSEEGARWPFRDALAIFAACVMAFLPLFLSGNWFDSHDGIRFLCLFEQFRDAFKEGLLYPRWLPDNYGGYGYPDFVFYQPAFFYFVLPFSLLLGDTLISFFAAMLVLLFLGSLGIYFLSRLFCGAKASLAAAVLFVLTPYTYVDIYVRGDLAEFASMMVLPWLLRCLVGADDALKGGRGVMVPFVTASLLAALLVYMHPFTSLFFYPLFMLVSLFPFLEGDSGRGSRLFVFAALAIFAGACLGAPYWLPAFLMKGHVNYRNALSGELQTHLHLLHPMQFFSTRWGFGGSAAGPGDGMSFQLGIPHFALACAGFALSKSRRVRAFFVLYMLSLLLIVDSAVNRFIWGWVPLLDMVQFPWRLLSVVATLQVLCSLPCLERIWRMRKGAAPAIFAGLLCVTAFIYRPAFFMRTSKADVRKVLEQHVEGRKMIMASYSSFNEFFPSHIKRHPGEPRGGREILQISGNGARIRKLSGSSSYRYAAVVSSQGGARLRVLQFYFPGMSLSLDHRDLTLDVEVAEDGTFSVEIPPGKHLVEVSYPGTPYDFIAMMLAFSGGGLAFFAMLVARKSFLCYKNSAFARKNV